VRRLIADIDRLLRGGYTRKEDLQAGRIDVPVRTLVYACLVLGAFYGLMMGLYALSVRDTEGVRQLVATALKVPLLFLLTLLVTFPSLYVSSALCRMRIRGADTLRLLLGAIAVHLAVLASLGPVTAFFTLSTDSYPFMKVLNVFFFAVSGLVGLAFLHQALTTVLEDPDEVRAPDPPKPPAGGEEEPDPDAPQASAPQPAAHQVRARIRTSPQTVLSRRVFTVWLLIYGTVGAQMGWILRPFIGSPDLPVEWFRERESNIVLDFFKSLGELF